ncbi:hypothetical protein PPYR_14753 [Photinus pyralis]|uniref:UDP-glucuronosyltransferase n=3 Tax=Photinus pyralis TaxID=7054 RepID=A0A5N4A631_PHOPY|nr:UDP-glucuronosyltransferase 1-6-like [Photinus pyralis]KAB0792794.1 hypothetical protein PPYR_14753 [Photinus pyralis]
MKEIWFVFSLVVSCSSERILAVTPSHENQAAFQPLWKELVSKGHHITLLTTDSQANWSLKKVNEINLGSALSTTFEKLDHPKVRALIADQTERFDLLMVDYTMPELLLFSQRFNCPSIGLLAKEVPIPALYDIGNPTYPYPRRFRDRIANVVNNYLSEWLVAFRHRELQKLFGSNHPPSRDPSALLVFSNQMLLQNRPLVPNVIQVGQLTNDNAIPKDVLPFLDEATEGFIYINLAVPPHGLLEALADIPYKLVWDSILDNQQKKPPNMLTRKHLPRRAILEHPKIKLLVTSGDLQTLDDAVSGHVPVICMPLDSSDEESCRTVVVDKGFGISIDPETLHGEDLKRRIDEVVLNPLYRDNLQRFAKLLRNSPLGGLDLAVWWTEYVLRHNGAPHLRSPLCDLPWWQYLFIDVLLAYLLITLCLLVIIGKVIGHFVKLN